MGFIVNPYRYGVSTLVYDTFTDSDNTALSAHTPDINNTGDTWTLKTAGDIEIIGNVLKPTGSDQLYAIDVGTTNVTMSGKITFGNNVSSYVIFAARTDGTLGSGWRAYANRSSVFTLYENNTSRATGSTTVVFGTEYDLEVIWSGTNIKVYLDGNLEIDHTIVTTESYGTYCGLQQSRLAYQSTIDDLLITTP